MRETLLHTIHQSIKIAHPEFLLSVVVFLFRPEPYHAMGTVRKMSSDGKMWWHEVKFGQKCKTEHFRCC
jgi:hypothetical protein